MEAGTLRCPSCGAAVSDDSTQCKYCSAQLQSVACPSCFGLMFVGSKFCPHCGAAAVIADSGPVVAHQCPRCPSEKLQRAELGGVWLEECFHCGGLWVAAEVFNKICADRQVQEAAIAMQLPPPITVQHTVQYLKCPQCSALMNRFNFANRSGVVMDKCRAHGLWLERDDLRRIIEFIQAGGLTIAREHEIEELKRQREMLEADHMQKVTGDTTSLYRDSSAGSTLGGLAGLLSFWD